MSDLFYVFQLLVDFMKSCELEVGGLAFTLWDLNIAFVWFSAAVFVYKEWKEG